MQPKVNELTACALRERPSISCVGCDENLSVSKNPQKTSSLNGTADSVDFDSILDVLPEFTDQVSDSHMKDVPGSQEEPKDHRCPSFGVFGKASTKRNHRETHVDVVHGEDKPDKLNGRMAKQVDLDDTDPSKFPCGTCEIIFDDPATLSDHAIRFHQGRNAYRCHVCEVPFFSVRGVIRHETTFHNIANPDFPVKSPKPPTESCEPPAKNRKGRRRTNPEIRRKQPESRKSAPFCNSSRVPDEPSFTVDGINFLESLMTEKKRKRRRHAEIPSLPMVPTHIEPPSAGVGAMAAVVFLYIKATLDSDDSATLSHSLITEDVPRKFPSVDLFTYLFNLSTSAVVSVLKHLSPEFPTTSGVDLRDGGSNAEARGRASENSASVRSLEQLVNLHQLRWLDHMPRMSRESVPIPSKWKKTLGSQSLNSVFKGLVPTVFTHCPVKPKHNAAPKTTERVQPGAEVNSPRMETVTNHQLADSSESLRKADPMVIRPLVLDEVNIRSTAPKTTERVQPGAEVNSPRMETVTNHQLADSSESLRKADPMVIRPLVLDEVNIQSVASEPILARLKAEQTASNCPSKRPTKSMNKRPAVCSPSIPTLKPEPRAE